MLPLHLLFVVTLIFGTFVAINSSSWFIAWIGLEVNLLSLLPIMAGEKTKSSSESCVKYFLIQSMASLLILISSVFIFSPILMNSMGVIFLALSVKLGVAPFHYWFPVVMEGVNWINCLILMTWQKLAPLFLVSFVKILILLILVTSLVGAFGGFTQWSLKKIMAFSSINHVGWMLAGMMVGAKVGTIYFGVYFLMSVLIILTFLIFKLFSISQIGSSTFWVKIIILLNLLSLGGLPPFIGFFPKWFVIEKLLWSSFFVAMVLIFSSLVSLYFYLRVCYSSLLLQYEGSERSLGGTFFARVMVAFLFFSSGGVFCYPLLSSM